MNKRAISVKSSFSVSVDIDECSAGEHGCEHVCINTFGSYFCMCRNRHYIHQVEGACSGRYLSHFNFNIIDMRRIQTLITYKDK